MADDLLSLREAAARSGLSASHLRLEAVQRGLVSDPDGDYYVEYRDERQEWETALPALRALRPHRDGRGWRALAEGSGLSERALRYALNGGKMPRTLGHVVGWCPIAAVEPVSGDNTIAPWSSIGATGVPRRRSGGAHQRLHQHVQTHARSAADASVDAVD